MDLSSTSRESIQPLNQPNSMAYKPLKNQTTQSNSNILLNPPKMTISINMGKASNQNTKTRSVLLQDATRRTDDQGTPAPPAPGYTADTVQQPSRSAPTASGLLAAANHLNKNTSSATSGQMNKQAYFAHIQTPVDAMKLVNIRCDFAITGLNTLASILDDKAAESIKKADESKALLKVRYEEQTTDFGHSHPYRYQDAKELANKLIERETSSLNQRLHAEEARLSTCPDAPLWVGVPMSLVPGNIIGLAHKRNGTSTSARLQRSYPTNLAGPSDPAPTPLEQAPPALYLDMIQIGQNSQKTYCAKSPLWRTSTEPQPRASSPQTGERNNSRLLLDDRETHAPPYTKGQRSSPRMLRRGKAKPRRISNHVSSAKKRIADRMSL